MKTRKIDKPIIGETLLYFLVWAMALLVPILNSKMMSEEHVPLVDILIAWSKLFPYIFIFIINNSILAPYLLFRRRYISYVVLILVMLVVVFYSLEYYMDSIRHLPYAGADTYIIQGRASFTDLAWYWNVLLGVLMMLANCGIKVMFKAMHDEHRIISLERQNLQAEMEALKYQINPHFFMNTLNNIHALIDIDTSAAKATVIELSKMMRYVLYDSEKHVTDLVDDVNFLEHYISLMRIRYTNDVDIRFDVQSPMTVGVKVPPLLLIVFVENAFKHGVSYAKPSYVHIKLDSKGGYTSFEVRNSRHSAHGVMKGGVGLENVRKRLELIYDGNYSLEIDSHDENEYVVKLSIPVVR